MKWFTKNQNGEPVYVGEDPQFSDRVDLGGDSESGFLQIRDLRESDSGVYYFRVETDQPGGIYTSDPGVSLSVKQGPDMQLYLSPVFHSGPLYLRCRSSCYLNKKYPIIWYKNGEEIQKGTSYYQFYSDIMFQPFNLDAADSYSCAFEGFKEFPSPLFCESASFCNRVSYTDRRICAPKGSSVNISCSFNSYSNITSKFWFSPKYSHHWKYSIPPEDLSEDYHQSDRIQVFETEKGHSTLRITNLGESDSAEYHFKFKTQSFEWNSSLPATTLTVTALQVQMIEKITNQSSTFVVLRCLSSCSPADHVSYTWFRNRETDLSWGETSVFKGWFPPEDEISCALKGHEQFPSPPVCEFTPQCQEKKFQREC
ncbi:B-cell receptor CD22-like [Xyrichtys novacula]|uniref:B-cell receptor CD22-like n=1 Tax=Xyrichtys novacula TaxID=13765 RepID=A0AAV1GY11_XYRNO|nr:B-cell receptor CD22-like [Xyrichtys novacula]